MKRLLITLSFLSILTGSYSQPYTSILKEINSFLTTFDNGYYGYLSIEDGILSDHYKVGTFSKIPISDISEAKVIEANRKIAIYCNMNAECVTTNTGSKFDNMPFSTTSDFNAVNFAAKINALVDSYKNKSTTVKTTAAFPERSRVKVVKEDKPFSLLDALSDEENPNNNKDNIGMVIGADLVSLGDGWYSGRLKMDDGTVKVFKKAQFEIVK